MFKIKHDKIDRVGIRLMVEELSELTMNEPTLGPVVNENEPSLRITLQLTV